MQTTTLVIGLALAGSAAAAVLPDPTRPYDFAAAVQVQQPGPSADAHWRLSGIRIRGEDHSAIVNGQVVRAGDELDGARITEISAGEVVLVKDQRQIVLKLLLSTVKKPVDMDTTSVSAAGSSP